MEINMVVILIQRYEEVLGLDIISLVNLLNR